jgi:hypothetical protein
MKTNKPKIATGFISVYATSIDANYCIALIERVSETSNYYLRDEPRRPHKTMRIPLFYNAEDSMDLIELKSIFFSALSTFLHDYLSSMGGLSIEHKNNAELEVPVLIVSKLLPGMNMPTHMDVSDSSSDDFIATLYINDDYENGEIVFENQSFEYKPLSGEMVFFRSAEPHGVNSAQLKERYSLACAFNAKGTLR